MRSLILGLFACAIAFGQVTPATASNDAHQDGFTSLTISYPFNNAAGNLLWASSGVDNTTGGTATVTDSQGNSWSKASSCVGSGYGEVEIWYAPNSKSGFNTVTLTAAGGSGVIYSQIHEWTNIKLTSPVDVIGACNVAASSPFTSNSATTTGSNDLVTGVIGTNSGSALSGGTGFTAGTGQVVNIGFQDEWGVFSPGSQAANFTSGGGANAPTLMVSFKPLTVAAKGFPVVY